MLFIDFMANVGHIIGMNDYIIHYWMINLLMPLSSYSVWWLAPILQVELYYEYNNNNNNKNLLKNQTIQLVTELISEEKILKWSAANGQSTW